MDARLIGELTAQHALKKQKWTLTTEAASRKKVALKWTCKPGSVPVLRHEGVCTRQ